MMILYYQRFICFVRLDDSLLLSCIN